LKIAQRLGTIEAVAVRFDWRYLFGVTDETISQPIVIRPNGTEPAIGIRGVGTRTKLTRDISLDDRARMITTEAYLIAESQVIEPTVQELYLYGNIGIPDHPYADEAEKNIKDPVCHAIALDGDAPTVSSCKVFDFRGDAISISNSAKAFSRMVRMPRITNNKISHCWNGIVAAAPDTQIYGNRIASVRDHGIRCTGGSIQCGNNHVFGARWGITFEGGPSRSIGDRFSDAEYGLRVLSDASGSDIIGGTTEHCLVKNIDVRVRRVRIENCRIFVANSSMQAQGIIGCDLHWEGSRAVMTDCEVRFPDFSFGGHTNITGSTGIYLQQHDARLINIQLSGSPQNGEVGVRVAEDRRSIYIEVDTSGNGANPMTGGGFAGSNDRIVKFDPNTETNLISGIVYVTHEPGENAVEIAAGWTSALKIFTRLNSSPTWTELTTGQAYPQ
jgi:hypothetical protein